MRLPPDVVLDARITRRMSVGMRAYAVQLSARLPKVAPSLRFEVFRHGTNFGIDEQVRLPLHIWRSGARLVHFLSLYTPIVVPRPSAITIHDLIHLRFARNFKPSVKPYYATVVRQACARASRVITDDPRTAGDLERLLSVDRAKIRIVPLGIDDVFRSDTEPEQAQRPYFLYAGNHRAHKDLATLLAAWHALSPDREVDIYLTGFDDDPALDTRPREHGAVRFLGDVDATQLARLYRGAAAYVHPALCEGFGLPMLEAAAAGTRVIACSEALPSVLDGCADTFPPRDVTRLRELLAEALDAPLTPELRERLRAKAGTYTWDRCALATAEVYREILHELQSR